MKNLDGRQVVLMMMIIMAAICLWLGLTFPVIRLSKYYFDETDHSILSTVQALLHHKEYLLAAVIAVFAILMPVLKLLYLLILAVMPNEQILKQRKTLMAVQWIGKWSMQDVLILAFTILYIKSSSFSQAVNIYGVYFFAMSVCLIMISYRDVRIIHWEAFKQLEQNRGKQAALYSPSKLSPSRRYIITILTFGAVVFLVLGVTQPVLLLTHFYVFSQEHSILSVTLALFSKEQYTLSGIIFMFSVIFPGIKMLYLVTVLLLPPTIPKQRVFFFKIMDWLGRWSMMDVMILALMVFYLNGSAISEAATLPGIYFFAVSVFLTMIAYGGVKASRSSDTFSP